jgi:hypothetical protein
MKDVKGRRVLEDMKLLVSIFYLEKYKGLKYM